MRLRFALALESVGNRLPLLEVADDRSLMLMRSAAEAISSARRDHG